MAVIRKHTGAIPNISHKELVDRAFLWLTTHGTHHHTISFRERSTSVSETPDAIGFYGSTSTLIECKASRADFLSDREKYFRRKPEEGMGHKRYFMCPVGLLQPNELPDKWGLLEVYEKENRRPHAVRIAKDAEPFWERNLAAEIQYLVSAIRRIEISMAVYVVPSE
jgi:hypothetical protein